MSFKKLPALSAKKVEKAIKRAGFVLVRQKGSHAIYVNPLTKNKTIIPIHSSKTIKKPLLMAIIKDCELTIKEFLDLI